MSGSLAKHPLSHSSLGRVPIQVYPVGIPLLYAFILWINRESLNPRTQSADAVVADAVVVDADSDPSPNAKTESVPKETPEELEERLKKRMENPDLVPSMFLWKDFGEGTGAFFFVRAMTVRLVCRPFARPCRDVGGSTGVVFYDGAVFVIFNLHREHA